MAARGNSTRNRQSERGSEGQSLIEFLLLLPLMLGLVMLTIRMNTAIQMAIVDQQYARAQTLWLAFNSNTYPQLRLREGQLTQKGFNQMTLGVSDNPVQEQDGTETGQIVPTASTEMIAPPGAPRGEDAPQDVTNSRSLVRVRNTVSLCTQANVLTTGQNGPQPLLPLAGNGATTFTASGPWALKEGNVKFQYCSGVAQ